MKFLSLILLLFSGLLFAQERPGFYTVEGETDCIRDFGSVIFLKGESFSPVPPDRNCRVKFQNNDLRTVGLCSRFQSHRGDTRKYPANTLAAFEDAIAQGFSGVELDIWLSKDGKAIVSHDNKLKAGTNCKGKISEKMASDIEKCMAVRSSLIPERKILAKKSDFPQPVPTLKEVLEKHLKDPRAQQLVIDIKPIPGGEALIKAIQDAYPACEPEECLKLQHKLTFISQAPEDVPLLKKAFPESNIALESNKTVSGFIDQPDDDYWGEHCPNNTLSLSFNSIFDLRLKILKFLLNEDPSTRKNFNKLYEKNKTQEKPKRILGWTVNGKSGIKALKDYQLDDVLTDLPYEKVVEILMEETNGAEMKANITKLNNGEKIGCEK